MEEDGGTRGCPPRVTASFGLAGGGGGGGRARRLPAGATQEGSGGAPPIPQPPNPPAVCGGGSTRVAAPSPRSAASGSASPRTADLCTGRGGGGHGGFCETGRSRGRCQAAPRRAPTRGRGASGTDGGRPSRCSRERGWGGGGPPRREGQREGRCPRRCLSTFPARRSVSNGAAASGIAPGPPARLGSWAPQWGTWQCCVGPPALLGPQQWGTGGGGRPWECHCAHCHPSAVHRGVGHCCILGAPLVPRSGLIRGGLCVPSHQIQGPGCAPPWAVPKGAPAVAPGQLCRVTHSAPSPFPTPRRPSVGHGDIGAALTSCAPVMTLKCGTPPIGGASLCPTGLLPACWGPRSTRTPLHPTSPEPFPGEQLPMGPCIRAAHLAPSCRPPAHGAAPPAPSRGV